MSKNVPLLTVLSFSGGKQSSALLWMILLDKIAIPDNFVILTADPGMENTLTYKYIDMMERLCREDDIEFYRVIGPNLYEDIINLGKTDKTRFDTPAYFVDTGDGIEGKLLQGCTQVYKIAPMKRKVRDLLYEKFVISTKSKRLGENIVEYWIGFSYSEIVRIKPAKTKYEYFRYPLIEMKMDNEDILRFYNDNNLPIPPRSVCNACFANGIDTLKDMYRNRSKDWEQAKKVDNSVRDWKQIGVKYPVYVNRILMSLQEMENKKFAQDDDKENEYSCDSGYCFL